MNRVVATVLVALGCVAMPACSKPPELGEVTGVILLDGKPIGDIEVVFSPRAEKGTTGPLASGKTGSDGRFTLRTEYDGEASPGAVVGTHRVLLRDLTAQPVTSSDPKLEADTWQAPNRSRIAKVLADAQQTPLQEVQVVAGSQELKIETASRKTVATLTVVNVTPAASE